MKSIKLEFYSLDISRNDVYISDLTNHSVIDTPSTYLFSKDKFIGKYHEGSFNPRLLEKWIFETLEYNYLKIQRDQKQKLKLDKREEIRKQKERENAKKAEELYI